MSTAAMSSRSCGRTCRRVRHFVHVPLCVRPAGTRPARRRGTSWWPATSRWCSSRSSSPTRCGCCSPRAPPGCPRAWCTGTAGSPWRGSSGAGSMPGSARASGSSPTPPPAGRCGTSRSTRSCRVRAWCSTRAVRAILPGAVWEVAARTGAQAMLLGAAVITATANAGVSPREQGHDLSRLRHLMVSGSALPSAGYHWVMEQVSAGPADRLHQRRHRHLRLIRRRQRVRARAGRPDRRHSRRCGLRGLGRRRQAGGRLGRRPGRHPTDAVDAGVPVERPGRGALHRVLLRHLAGRVATR